MDLPEKAAYRPDFSVFVMSSFLRLWKGTFGYKENRGRVIDAQSGHSRARRANEMQDSERVMLSAVEKWTKYGRFPYKLILHSTILMLVTIQVSA